MLLIVLTKWLCTHDQNNLVVGFARSYMKPYKWIEHSHLESKVDVEELVNVLTNGYVHTIKTI